MSDMENAKARQEAVESSSRASASPNRQRFWAGLNRYLTAETEHAHKAGETEKRNQPADVSDGTSGAA